MLLLLLFLTPPNKESFLDIVFFSNSYENICGNTFFLLVLFIGTSQ